MAIKYSLSENPIFVPDISYLLKFSKGDLGIADNIHKKTILNNLSSLKNEKQLNIFFKSVGALVTSPQKYFKDGKYFIPESEIKLDPSKNQSGLKSLEKSTIQSIFDSQKPYMDLFSELGNVLITIEDIIARTLAIADKSQKPATNPKALGYKNNGISNTKNELSKLKSLTKNKNTTVQSSNGSIPNNYHYEEVSRVYSTGEYLSNVDYTYEYIDINNIENKLIGTGSENTFKSKLPKTLIIAVFDNFGNIISDDDINNSIHNLDWIKNSGKWFGNFNYLSDVNSENISLYNRYFKEHTEDNLPDDMNLDDKKLTIDNINNIISKDNNKVIQDLIDGYKTGGFLPSVIFSNPDKLVNKVILTGNVIDRIPDLYGRKRSFSVKKLNINNNKIWIDPESDYDFKLLRCDVNNESNIITKEPYSNDVYGSDEKQKIDTIYRNSKLDTNDDIFRGIDDMNLYKGSNEQDGYTDYHKTYYILEGILSEDNNQSVDKKSNSNISYYRKPAFFSAVKQFINLIIQISSKLKPTITSIQEISKNPLNFIIDIMKGNLGDNNGTKDIKFIFFSSEFNNKFKSLDGKNNKDKFNIINNSILKNYVVLNKNGEHKFLMAGSGFSFLGKNKIGFKTDEKLKSDKFSSIYPVNPPNKESKLNFTSLNESETIDYIGGYNPNITYEYIYINNTILNLLKEAENLENKGDLDSAKTKYVEILKLNPNNKFASGKIDSLDKLINSFGGSSIFNFILSMMTLPLEIILGIVEEIIKILGGLTSPTTLKDSISKLLSFSIFPGGLSPLEFFNPIKILSLAKIEFNIDLFLQWVNNIKKSPLKEYDLNKIMKLPYVSKFPTYSKKSFEAMVFSGGKINLIPLKMLTGILEIFEGIINAIIDFFWALMGMSIIKKPKLKFTKNSNNNISSKDITALINGTYNDIIDPNDDNNYDFHYNIKLPDGKNIRNLNTDELQKFINEHKEFIFINN